MGHDGAPRLLLALSVSTALHLSLIYGIAVTPSPSVLAPTIAARLVSEAVVASTESGVRGAASRRRSPAAAFVPAEGELWSGAIADSSRGPESAPLPAVAARLDESRLPSADVPLLVDVAWYDAKDLDLYPHPLAPVRPAYPTSAPDVSGEVTLLLLIDEAGAVHQLSVVAAEPPGYFEEPALRAFQVARFAPAQREGRPVRSRVVVKVRFAPEQRIDDRN
jgi:protein TonB